MMQRAASSTNKPRPLHRRAAMLTVIGLLTSGCGQTGPLYLPESDVERGGMSLGATVNSTVNTIAGAAPD